MSWDCKFSRDAESDLIALPKSVQEQVALVVEQMECHPFFGDVDVLAGKPGARLFYWKAGNYWLIFQPNYTDQFLYVLRIVLRPAEDVPTAV